MKICSTCKVSKPYSEFNKDKSKKDGYRYICRECTNNKRRPHYRSGGKYLESEIEYRRKRRAIDSDYALRERLRGRITSSIRKNSKSTMDYIGCDIDTLKIYLTYTAIANDIPDFDIDTYDTDEYHIDHIKPIASFDLTNEDEVKKCFHYTNLQILTSEDNLRKGDRT